MQRPRWRSTRRETIDVARGLRREPTPAEAMLWDRLRDRRLVGLKFRRQHIRGHFILDFYNAEHRLSIEIDGPVHDQQRREDAERTAQLNEWRIRVVRFTNNEVENDVEGVLRRIVELCRK